MCGIVGLFLKNSTLEPELGALVADMLGVLSDRGPDSAGFAVYGDAQPKRIKVTLRVAGLSEAEALFSDMESALACPAEFVIRDSHAVLSIPVSVEAAVRVWLSENRPDIRIVGAGRRMELFKEVGWPKEVADRFGLSGMSGTHAIGHTRMATESSVTTDGAHPFSTGSDQCLVHNGSLSNHNTVRRELMHAGYRFATDNDTEVAAVYLTAKLRDGLSLREALAGSLRDLDGVYTFGVGA